jgi:hypothetical protein
VTRRALLIGSQTYGLGGCDADVALMAEVLTARGFEAIDTRTGDDASRAGLIDGLESLIAAVDTGDAVVVYYSGHGGRVVRPDFDARKAAGLSVHFQFIVPYDMTDSDIGDFRGLLSEELTQYQRRLSDAFRRVGDVPNVTTILDCCHSGYMARDVEARPKSVDFEAKMFRMRGIREHVQTLGAAAELGGLRTNPDAVRLAACQPEQSAFEIPSTRGGRHGALTDALASVLAQLGPTPVSWAVIGDLVRRRVRALMPEQRPEVEGPTSRLPFSSESVAAPTALPVALVDGVAQIEAAQLLGISVGDEFRVIAAGGTEAIGTAVVSNVDGGNAVLAVSPDKARTALANGAIAVPTRVGLPKAPVGVDGTDASSDALRSRIRSSNRIAVSDEPSGVIARVAPAEGGGLTLFDHVGAPWRTGEFADDDGGHRRVVQVLEAIAVGHRLVDLASGHGTNALDAAVAIDFGVIDGSTRRPLDRHGAQLTAGAHVFLTLRNLSPESLFAWVFDVGVSGRSSLITNAAPSGTMLGPAGAEDDTLPVWGPEGEPLFWPDDVPTTPSPGGIGAARDETFVVILADRRSDLSSLASPGEVRGAASWPLRYRLEQVEFLLSPGHV